MTGTQAQSRHNECTTPGARGAKSDARFVPACDYQDRFTEPPHRATEAKQPGQGRGSPILVPGNVTERPTPGHPRQRPPHPAPVAQWIEQAPSKRLAAGSSPAGGALSSLSFGRAFLLLRAGVSRYDEAAGAPLTIKGGLRGCPAVTGFLRATVSNTCRSSLAEDQPVSGGSGGLPRLQVASSDQAVARRHTGRRFSSPARPPADPRPALAALGPHHPALLGSHSPQCPPPRGEPS